MLKSKFILLFLSIWFLNVKLYSNVHKYSCPNTGNHQTDPSLKDKNGHLIGKIKTKPDGTQEIRDKNGHYLGKYNPKTNFTYDKNGHKVGSGNLLSSLLNK